MTPPDPELLGFWSRHLGLLLFLQTLLAFLAGLVAVRLAMRRHIARMADWMRRVRVGDAPPAPPRVGHRGLLAPLAAEAATLAKSLAEAHATAEQEARLRQHGDSLWTAERLREHVRANLSGRQLVIVANREPYRHRRQGRGIVWEMPASGLVTGLEPLLRACGGTWIAHGDGDADFEATDPAGRVRVPPGDPQYTLRRLRLSAEEEAGYYYGFSNEGLWPLCHIAHTRPVFRPEDWDHYRRVNAKFAGAVLEEIAEEPEPFILIQDYHFTLLPRLIKEKRPDARLALFWHIPWPNSEAFGICPWRRELLDGMLGADVIGFHTQSHCNNFLETVDATLECRVDWDRFAVKRGGRTSVVKPFPISVDFPEPSPVDKEELLSQRADLLDTAGIHPEFVAVGVDRLDYTKGILERFRGVERFLDKHARYQGRFTLFQIGAPSRTHIPAYRRFVEEVESEAKRINARFGGKGAPPIMLLARAHSHAEIRPYFRAADVCMVTSLHDGMNLVAKEFAAAREDERGVLILSRFTGASRELRDALIVNPYDSDELAEALRRSIEMDDDERALRMVRLRRGIRENNIYHWAAGLITELASVRREPVKAP